MGRYCLCRFRCHRLLPLCVADKNGDKEPQEQTEVKGEWRMFHRPFVAPFVLPRPSPARARLRERGLRVRPSVRPISVVVADKRSRLRCDPDTISLPTSLCPDCALHAPPHAAWGGLSCRQGAPHRMRVTTAVGPPRTASDKSHGGRTALPHHLRHHDV